jgi:hypothetical protein
MPALYLPEPSTPPDPEWRETLEGGHALIVEYTPGHALVIEYGDCEFYIHCECQKTFEYALRPNRPWLPVFMRWQTHCAGPARAVQAHCQCGRPLGSLPAGFGDNLVEDLAGAWERHTMTEVRSERADGLEGGTR